MSHDVRGCKRVHTRPAAPVMLGLLLAQQGCLADPVLERQIAELGVEDPDVPIGPLHRPNQPCLVCHSPRGVDAGAAETIFSVAGTVYRGQEGEANGDGREPEIVWPVRVTLTDSKRVDKQTWRTFTVETNCAGNFYVKPSKFDPVYPMWVDVDYNGVGAPMKSPIRGDGSCASCHTDPPEPLSNGHIFVLERDPGDPAFAPRTCDDSADDDK